MEDKKPSFARTYRDTFKNPFEDINANELNPEQINDYWCSPFSKGLLTDFDENSFRTNKVPIILQGSRGSGKTMILKYFAFPAQFERSKKNKKESYLDLVKLEGSIGFYFRCDDSFIKTFQTLFEGNKGTACFEHYLELALCSKILEMIRKVLNSGELKDLDIEEFVKTTTNNYIKNIDTLQLLEDFISDQIQYINSYRNRVAFTNEEFRPQNVMTLFSLSNNMIDYLKENISEFRDVIFVLMIDEFENLTKDLQRRFNTLIKFVRPNITIRVGRRSEGIITTETVNKEEYLRKNHDYFLASLEKEYDKKDNNAYREYFLDIAKRRFSIYVNDGKEYDLLRMLGDRENLDLECRENCRGRNKHIESILKQAKEIEEDSRLCSEIIQIISNKENPIAETLNALWVIRAKNNKTNKDFDFLQVAHNVKNIMHGYFNKENSDEIKKYGDDYTNKYRYAITVYICSVYKRPKLYYGFNAISYLANGNTRTFINLCRAIISDALFYENDTFRRTGVITKETQSRAIHNYSQEEFDEVCAIITYGYNIRNLIINIGNVFSVYHKDKRIRYPETNQFTFDVSALQLFNSDDFNIIQMALSWAMIIKRERLQRLTAGSSQKGYIYHINKIFYPIFNISYRTRGGVNEEFSSDEIHEMLRKQDVFSGVEDIEEYRERKKSVKKHSVYKGKKAKNNGQIPGQLSLFE